jgi:D-alanyl-D-alanine carboxypeptidase (penicillin-binding protein 5/6)
VPRGVAVVVALATLLVGALAPGVSAQTTTTVPPPPPPPKAWVLVDADTGAVVAGSREREPMLVASVFKVFTALVVVENLPADADVPVSARAAGMPARKMQLQKGEVWRASDLLHALLLASANDAAVALAERVAESLEGFGGMLDRTAERLGLADGPVLRDPAGLDDEFSVGGGNLISARDLAIATRAFLAYDELTAIVALPEYRFTGGDAEPHRLLNHNRLLKLYPGAIGVKTGYTKRAGHSLIAAARREGRTMVAVVLGAADPYRSAMQLLDTGFATPVAAQETLDHLPQVSLGDGREPDTGAAPAPRPVSTPAGAAGNAGSGIPRDLVVLVVGSVPAVAILVRRRRVGRSAQPAWPV